MMNVSWCDQGNREWDQMQTWDAEKVHWFVMKNKDTEGLQDSETDNGLNQRGSPMQSKKSDKEQAGIKSPMKRML